MNVVDPILYHARSSPNAIAICTPRTDPESVTYAELEGLMNNIGRIALSNDLARGQIVAIYMNDTILHIAIILALMRLGITTVSAWSPVLPKDIAISAVITDASVKFENAPRVIFTDKMWKQFSDKPLADERFYQVGADDLCRIVLTSGTTGDAKGIGYTQKMLIERIPRFDYAMGNRLPTARRLYSDLGIASATGFRVTLYMLWKGATVYLFGADSESMVQAFDLFQVEGMLTSPNGLATYLRFYEFPGAPECSFEFILCLGASMPRSLSERARAHMCPDLYSVYGSTEVSTIASAPVHRIAHIPGAVGFITPDVTVEIVDGAGKTLSSGQEGFVRVKSPYNASGYIGGAAEPVEAFRDGWFYPGDIGTVTADRILTIRGRESSLINLGGIKLNPELIEELLARHSDVQDAAVFALPNDLGMLELWAAVIAATEIDWAALQKLCAERLGRSWAPTHFLRVPELPRNNLGKVDRSRLADLVTRK